MAGPTLRLCSSPPSFPPPVSPRAYSSHSLLFSLADQLHRVFILSVLLLVALISHVLSLCLAQGENGSRPFPSADFAADLVLAEDRPLTLSSCAPGLSPVLPLYSPRSSAPTAASLVASRFFFAVFFSLCIAFLTRCIMEFLFSTPARLRYHFLTVFSPSSKFRCFIMNGRIGIRPNNARAVYHRSRKSIVET